MNINTELMKRAGSSFYSIRLESDKIDIQVRKH